MRGVLDELERVLWFLRLRPRPRRRDENFLVRSNCALSCFFDSRKNEIHSSLWWNVCYRTFFRYSEDERDDVLVAVGGDETRIAGACAQVAKGYVAGSNCLDCFLVCGFFPREMLTSLLRCKLRSVLGLVCHVVPALCFAFHATRSQDG